MRVTHVTLVLVGICMLMFLASFASAENPVGQIPISYGTNVSIENITHHVEYGNQNSSVVKIDGRGRTVDEGKCLFFDFYKVCLDSISSATTLWGVYPFAPVLEMDLDLNETDVGVDEEFVFAASITNTVGYDAEMYQWKLNIPKGIEVVDSSNGVTVNEDFVISKGPLFSNQSKNLSITVQAKDIGIYKLNGTFWYDNITHNISQNFSYSFVGVTTFLGINISGPKKVNLGEEFVMYTNFTNLEESEDNITIKSYFWEIPDELEVVRVPKLMRHWKDNKYKYVGKINASGKSLNMTVKAIGLGNLSIGGTTTFRVNTSDEIILDRNMTVRSVVDPLNVTWKLAPTAATEDTVVTFSLEIENKNMHVDFDPVVVRVQIGDQGMLAFERVVITMPRNSSDKITATLRVPKVVQQKEVGVSADITYDTNDGVRLHEEYLQPFKIVPDILNETLDNISAEKELAANLTGAENSNAAVENSEANSTNKAAEEEVVEGEVGSSEEESSTIEASDGPELQAASELPTPPVIDPVKAESPAPEANQGIALSGYIWWVVVGLGMVVLGALIYVVIHKGPRGPQLTYEDRKQRYDEGMAKLLQEKQAVADLEQHIVDAKDQKALAELKRDIARREGMLQQEKALMDKLEVRSSQLKEFRDKQRAEQENQNNQQP